MERGRRRRVEELLDVVGLRSDAARKLKTYSGGNEAPYRIAQALLNDPKLVIVDEPTVGLDPEERIRFRTLLAELAGDRTVILSTHIVEDVCADIAPDRGAGLGQRPLPRRDPRLDRSGARARSSRSTPTGHGPKAI